MRLIGFRYTEANPPLEAGFVPLDDLTVVLGANDVGKSRLLALMHDRLSGTRDGLAKVGAWFLEMSDEELEIFVLHCAGEFLRAPDNTSAETGKVITDVDSMHDAEGVAERTRAPWRSPDDEFRPPNLADLSIDEGWQSRLPAGWRPRSFDEYVRGLLEHRPQPSDLWEVVLDALRDSRILALDLDANAFVDGTDPEDLAELDFTWRCFWCLPAVANLPKHVRGAVERLGLADAALGGPVVVAPVGRLELPVMPISVPVPTGFDQIRSELDDAIESIVVHTQYFFKVRLADVLGRPVERLDGGKAAFVERKASGFVRVHPDVACACEFAEQTVQRLLPRFVSERYKIGVHVGDILDWTDGQRIELVLTDRTSDEEFSIEAVAQGHQLWLQLALYEAVDACRNLHITLMLALEDELAHLEAALTDQEREQLKAHGVDARVDAVEVAQRAGHSDYVDALEHFRAGKLVPLEADLAEFVARMPTGQLTQGPTSFAPGLGLLNLTRGRLYVMDEPEQHLNPRFQREAAWWLEDFVRTRPSSQAIIATHSVPFLEIRSSGALLQVRRPRNGRTVLSAIVGDSLRALDDAAREVGLDRGELLASTAVLLFVEGRADQRVLEELFASRLRAAGVTVVPIHGANRAVGLIEAETLLRFTSTPGAVWLDNISAEFLEQMRADPAFAATVKANAEKRYGSEEKTLADLVLTARELGRQIEPLPHPGVDIFDLLDEATIRMAYPKYPGHLVAAEERASERAKGNAGWKSRYQKLYGLDFTAQTLGELAARMRVDGIAPHSALEEVVFTCERLSLSLQVGSRSSAHADRRSEPDPP